MSPVTALGLGPGDTIELRAGFATTPTPPRIPSAWWTERLLFDHRNQ